MFLVQSRFGAWCSFSLIGVLDGQVGAFPEGTLPFLSFIAVSVRACGGSNLIDHAHWRAANSV
jgi:hypothetical protein